MPRSTQAGAHVAPVDTSFAKFFVVESNDQDKSVTKLNPFEIERAFKDSVGTIVSSKKLPSGALLAQVQSEAQAADLQKLNTLANCPVKISQHRFLNSSKGVVRSFDLSQMWIRRKFLITSLYRRSQQFQHITQNQNGQKQNSGATILTFSDNLPDQIKVGYREVSVARYIPKPLRCFGCQKFGHHQTVRKHQKISANCGLAAHDDETPCSRPPKCVNCGGDH